MNKQVSDRLAVVTGGTRGIGAAIAARLQQEGYRIIITGTQDLGDAKAQPFEYSAVNFLNQHEVDSLAAVLSSRKPDILINNAGINIINQFCEIDLTSFNMIQKVNLEVPFQLCQAVIPAMKEQGWGRIINISSIFGIISKELRASYSASKFGLDGLTTALAAEVAEYGILANCVSPGFIETELTRSVLGESGMQDMATRVPMKRLGSPQEVAALVAWLVSAENSYISGQNIVIDGGFCRV